MAGDVDMGRETPLVSALQRAGVRHGRAVAFERFLDDHHYAGFSADFLARVMMVLVRQGVQPAGAPESRSATPKPGSLTENQRRLWKESSDYIRAIAR